MKVEIFTRAQAEKMIDNKIKKKLEEIGDIISNMNARLLLLEDKVYLAETKLEGRDQ